MESATKSTWLVNAKRFDLEAESLEKKINISIKDLELQRLGNELKLARNKSKLTLAKKMSHFKTILLEIQARIMNGNIHSPHHQLKEQLEYFETKMSSFKLLMKAEFESIEDAAKDTEADVVKLAEAIDSWLLHDDDPNGYSEVKADKINTEVMLRNENRAHQDRERRAFIGGIDRKVIGLFVLC